MRGVYTESAGNVRSVADAAGHADAAGCPAASGRLARLSRGHADRLGRRRAVRARGEGLAPEPDRDSDGGRLPDGDRHVDRCWLRGLAEELCDQRGNGVHHGRSGLAWHWGLRLDGISPSRPLSRAPGGSGGFRWSADTRHDPPGAACRCKQRATCRSSCRIGDESGHRCPGLSVESRAICLADRSLRGLVVGKRRSTPHVRRPTADAIRPAPAAPPRSRCRRRACGSRPSRTRRPACPPRSA